MPSHIEANLQPNPPMNGLDLYSFPQRIPGPGLAEVYNAAINSCHSNGHHVISTGAMMNASYMARPEDRTVRASETDRRTSLVTSDMNTDRWDTEALTTAVAERKIATALIKAKLAAAVSLPQGKLDFEQESETQQESTPPFGWTLIDGIKIPYLVRDGHQYVAVKMVETKLLSKFPSTYPEELRNRPPLMSHYCTSREAKLLNEINALLCDREFGRHPFNITDLIVRLEDFHDFYQIVCKNFPGCTPALTGPEEPRAPRLKAEGGWLQINNTVVPYVVRHGAQYVPLSVIRYAAGLLTDVQVNGDVPSEAECDHLNDNCKAAGLYFQFSKATKLLALTEVHAYSTETVTVKELPTHDPFGHAEYVEGSHQNSGATTNSIVNRAGKSFVGDNGCISNDPHTMVPNPAGLSQTVDRLKMGKDYIPRPGSSGSCGSPHEVNNNRPSSTSSTPGENFLSQDGALDLTRKSPIESEEKMCPNYQFSGISGSGSVSMTTPSMRDGMISRPMRQPPPLIRQAFLPHGAQILPRLDGMGSQGGARQELRPNSQPSRSSCVEYQNILSMLPGRGLMQRLPVTTNSNVNRTSTSNSLYPKLAPKPKVAPRAPPTAPRHQPALPRSWPREQILLASGVTRPRGRPPKSASSEKNKPPPVTTVRVNTQPHSMYPEESLVKITAIPFHGRNISCLVKEDGLDGLQPFVLIEALAKVFFPRCPVSDFLPAVRNVLKVVVSELSHVEEQAFIQYYRSYPTKALHCNKIVKVKDIEECMPQLQVMFRDKLRAMPNVENSLGTSGETSTVPEDLLYLNEPLVSPIMEDDASTSGTLTSGRSGSLTNLTSLAIGPSAKPVYARAASSPAVTGSDLTGGSEDLSQMGGLLHPSGGVKRPASTPLSQPRPKNASRRLEDAVNRLKQSRAMTSGGNIT